MPAVASSPEEIKLYVFLDSPVWGSASVIEAGGG